MKGSFERNDVNMVVPPRSIPRCADFVMANTPLKSFSINSILPETVLDRRSVTPEVDEDGDDDRNGVSDADASDCESDLDVIGTSTPPLDCSSQSNEGEEKNADSGGRVFV